MGRTRALASCRRADGAASALPTRARAPAGFTLIELMVVLAIIAGLLAVAAPGFVRLYASVRVALEQQDLERQLLMLPRQVRTFGESGVLIDPQSDNPEHPQAALASTGIEIWRPLRLDLPAGWSASVPRPIFYHFTGICEGGEVTFSLPPLSLTYSLAAPLCRPQLADANAH